jgi:tetratricopeptide (TPR) repeat protein
MGRVEEARAEFEGLATNEFAGVPRDTFWLVAMNVLSDVCAALGDADRATILYRLIEPFAERMAVNVVGTCASSMARSLGRLAAVRRRFDEAIRHFESALAIEGRLKALPLLAHTRQQYADALLARGRPADTARAMPLLDHARQEFERLGMSTFAAGATASWDRARRLKRRRRVRR